MKFFYKARTQEGELQIGNVEAANKEAATNILLSHNLYVLSLEPVAEERWYDRIVNFFQRVNINDLMIFTRQFATLLASQVPIGDSLRSLYQQTSKPNLKEVIAELLEDVEAGFSISQALSRHPGVFSDFYVNMIKSAEVTGRLSEVMEFLADYLEKQAILRAKVRNALTYPIFVILLFIIAAIVMVTMVLPQITPIFQEAKVELPFFTKFLLNAGSFLSRWWWLLVLLLIIFIFLIIDYSQTEEGKIVFNELSLRVPILGIMFQHLYISRFAESARMLIKGGLTIPQAVEISAHTIGNYVYRDILHEVAQKIREGQLLSQALKGYSYFPPLVYHLIAVGEATGRLDQLLERISDFYRRQVEDKVNNLVELIQPALLIIIGLLVAGLFASILLPLYKMAQSF